MTKTKQLAIIKNVRLGVGDRDRAWLQCDLFVDEGTAALCIFEWDQAKEVVEAYKLRELDDLEGKSCWVNKGDGMITWAGPALI